jgi:hypothetical protein
MFVPYWQLPLRAVQDRAWGRGGGDRPGRRGRGQLFRDLCVKAASTLRMYPLLDA